MLIVPHLSAFTFAWRLRQRRPSNFGIGTLQGAFARDCGGGGGGGGGPPPPPIHRPRNPFNLTRATVALAFYRRHPLADCRESLCAPTSLLSGASQRMISHARNRRGCLIVKATDHENRLRLNLVTFATSPFFHVSRPQRLSPLASIPAIRRITDADSVTVFAKLYLFSS